MKYTRHNILTGVLIYAIGDTIAALILGEFLICRMFGIMCVGGTVYALEVPNYFRWIDARVSYGKNMAASFKRTALALLYFNPLWIVRHLFFINFFSGQWQDIEPALVTVGTWSFIANIPISLVANYLIQNKLPYRWRFGGSSVFSSAMAIYYALSEVFFG